ncbi:MAG: CotH kinase family protein [Bacteroidia bacterium]
MLLRHLKGIFLGIIVFSFLGKTHAKESNEYLNPLFENEKINKVEFWFQDDGLWDRMANEYRLKTKNYFKVRCVLNGEEFGTTGIRFKGKHSYAFAWTDKKPLKVKLNEYDDQSYHGVTKFNLSNAFEDPSFQRDVLSLKIMRQMGVPAPLASYAKVFINGEYFGLYILIEQLDSEFLKRCFDNDSGSLFESEGYCLGDEDLGLELKGSNVDIKKIEVVEFIDLIKKTSDTTVFSELQSRFNVESFIRACAVDVYLANLDSYAWGRCHNFYLYFDQFGKAHWIAWDYNLSFGYDQSEKVFYPVKADRNILLRRLLSNEEYLLQYWKAIEEVSKITSSRRFKFDLKRNSKLIRRAVEDDTNKFYSTDTFNISLNTTVLGGLTTRIPGLLEFTKSQRKNWEQFKREEEITLD